jgi:hypothetical protein
MQSAVVAARLGRRLRWRMPAREPARRNKEVITSWKDFLEHPHVASAQSARPWVLFRGQANAEHKLRPSLLRAVCAAHGKDPSHAQVVEYEEACRVEFAAQAHLYLGASLLSGVPTTLHWWMHMQHFIAPTRLLDWSRSPFVAAYFACESNPEGDGAVWSLDVRLGDFTMPTSFSDTPTNRQRKDTERVFLAEKPKRTLHLLNMGLRNERMVAQQGVFMLSPDAAALHDDILRDLPEQDPKEPKFRKIQIPKEKKREFFHHLLAMNINARSLFPGIDGVGRSISELARFDALPDLHPEP